LAPLSKLDKCQPTAQDASFHQPPAGFDGLFGRRFGQ
jgi:hypothetical protein